MTVLSVQLERPRAGLVDFSREALAAYADALAGAWQVLGVGEGDRVIVYDYGSSPVAYLASRAFAPYLQRGAAEQTNATAVCVDGLPDNVGRLEHVLRQLEPQFLFVRAELVPLLVAGPTAVPVELRGARLAVTADGDTPAAGERASWARDWPGGVSLLARCDAAAFLAAECPRCRTLWPSAEHYQLQVDEQRGVDGFGTLTVAPRFIDLGRATTELTVRPPAKSAVCPHAGFELA